MTTEEKTEFDKVQVGRYVKFKDDPDRWGQVTSISDCGEWVYYAPMGQVAAQNNTHYGCRLEARRDALIVF